MIAWIHGVLREKHPPSLIVEAGGIGYEMQAPMTTFGALPEIGREVSLHLHHLVREDASQLFAFQYRRDRDIFRQLLRVGGIGAKLALAILSGMEAQEFVRCVLQGDSVRLAGLPGIGRKTAERLVMELQDRFGSEFADLATDERIPQSPSVAANKPAAEAIKALIALGLKPPEATRRVSQIPDRESLPSEEIVRIALRGMAR
ncbi:Holliday junction branch migration protein RuvA [Thioalkalivibrio sp. HK1]|uniref:Holliday junction branch migration protein RuvA n=1 Tax=Thioalkalivibrio sp. HK1 TaxID=1469245 RepID=UPI00046FB2E9|nr:Holliday junction branch migration protein RuvA [Thioalkalivibrio sp. HK1]